MEVKSYERKLGSSYGKTHMCMLTKLCIYILVVSVVLRYRVLVQISFHFKHSSHDRLF
jgi:hypothetical protein